MTQALSIRRQLQGTKAPPCWLGRNKGWLRVEWKERREEEHNVGLISVRGGQVGWAVFVLISGQKGKPIASRDAPLLNFQSVGKPRGDVSK